MSIIENFDASRKAVREQNEFRTSWVSSDTVEKLTSMYWQEDEEYRQAKELCMLGADPYEFVGEAGDKAYLYIRLCDHTDNQVPPDIEADIAKTCAECEELGVDIIKATFFKIYRNEMKYPLMMSRNGYTFEQSQQLSKDQYKLMGGELAFLYTYMIMADSLQHYSS